MKRALLSLLTLIFSLTAFAGNSGTPAGFWQLLGDNGQPKIIIRIYQNSDKTFSGKVIEYYPNKAGRCTACTEQGYKDKEFRKMVIIKGLKQDGDNVWSEGKILDPETGKWSNLKMTMLNNGKALQFNSYGWFSWFGSKDTWTRRS